MCRLLGVVSTESAALTESLGDELEPFSQLSSIHCDGWGVAAWNGHDDLVVRKEPTPARVEPGLLDACAGIRADSAILHLRKASPGLAVASRNTHPFAVGSVAFAHNGYFPLDPAIDKVLADVDAEPVAGDTDSERYFHLVLALMRMSDPVTALTQAATLITGQVEAVSLNALMLTHRALYAFAFYDERAERPVSRSYELRFRVGDRAVRVASSGWEQPTPQWETLASGTILEVRRHDLCVSVHRPPSLTRERP